MKSAALVAFSGDLDFSKVQLIADSLPSPTSIDRLIIDCRSVTSIESVAIGVFLRYRRKFVAIGKEPLNLIFLIPKTLERIFNLAGMEDLVTVVCHDFEPGATE